LTWDKDWDTWVQFGMTGYFCSPEYRPASIPHIREKEELTAVFYLCKAWECMERADIEKEPSMYVKASDLFKEASSHFHEIKMKKLAIGNSYYALHYNMVAILIKPLILGRH
jgi:hypothetical protein